MECHLIRLEDEAEPDMHERIRHTVDAMRVDGWQAVGAVSSVQSQGLYLVFERYAAAAPPPVADAGVGVK